MTDKMNRNPALSTSYLLDIPGPEFKSLNYFCQVTEIPGLNMGGVETPHKNFQGSVPSNRIEYDPFNLTFMLSEDHSNHAAIQMWMHEIQAGKKSPMQLLKDVVLNITNSNKIAIGYYTFYQAYPTMLGPIPMESTSVDETTPMVTLMFRYQLYQYTKL